MEFNIYLKKNVLIQSSAVKNINKIYLYTTLIYLTDIVVLKENVVSMEFVHSCHEMVMILA